MIPSEEPIRYLAAFLSGMAVSFTPCVYPLIPVTAGYIAVRAGGSKLKGFILSVIYVCGIALVYSCLGLLASVTGIMFGKVSTHPLTYLAVGAVMFLFSFSMLDFIHLPFGHIARTRISQKQGYFPVFMLGLSSGLVASPCLTPVLGSILGYLATKKNILYGTTLLFTFAYGMGFILILVGTFSAALLGLPKSGKWMLYVQRACAFILMAVAAYFIYQGLKRL